MKRTAKTGALIGGLIVAGMCAVGCGRGERERPVLDPAARRVMHLGEVVGFTGRYGSHTWLGIPYAKPPVGTLRWRAPQPPDAWTGTREALAPPSVCTQYASPFGGVTDAQPGDPVGSEDCLYVNVYAPRCAPEGLPSGTARLPVMLWIHGGGNTIGEGGFYNGGNLAVTQNLIVITMNYRLGPFGWFRHAALRGDDTTDADRSGNFGTLDLIRALQWVQENASAFGGDPGNVTIFGESAGGTNVFSLLLSPPAHGLFHRAIVESGGLGFRNVAEAENFTDDAQPGDPNSSNEAVLRLLIADKPAPDRAAAKTRLAGMSPADVTRYLRAKTSFQILSAYPPLAGSDMINLPLVFRDGAVLPQDDPMQRFTRADGYNQVPVIVGTNRDENKLFMFGDPERVQRLLWIFPRLRDSQHYVLSAEYLAKMWKATGADEPAAAMRAVQGPNVFAYRFDWDEEPTVLGADLSVMLGAAHAFEIPFVFGHFDLGRDGNVIFTKTNEPSRMVLSKQMMSYWAEFAYHGAPGRGRDRQQVEWAPWGNGDAASPKYLIFDTAADGGLRLSSDTLTETSVLAAVDSDPRLPTQREKCTIFRELAEWSRRFTKQDYPSAGRNGCAAYPFDAYPWS